MKQIQIGLAVLLGFALAGCRSTGPANGPTPIEPTSANSQKKIVLIAGRPSHGPGDHEFRAGCLLLQKCLNGLTGINAVVYSNGWPAKLEGGKPVDDNTAFDGAAAVLIYADGGGGRSLASERSHERYRRAL